MSIPPAAEAVASQEPERPHPGVPFPPPLIPVSVFLTGLAIERWEMRLRWSDWLGLRGPFIIIGWIGNLVGLAIGGWGIATFWRAGTTVMPNQPSKQLVTSGPYRFTRNPMYLGLMILYLGLGLLFDLVWPILFLPLALLGLRHLVIAREERALGLAFGEVYARYRGRVRRWL